MSKIISGKNIAAKVEEKLKTEILEIKQPLRLAAVLVGDHPGSKRFLELKQQAAEKLGIDFVVYKFSADILEGSLIAEIRDICSASKNTGVLVELPLPRQLSTDLVLKVIPSEKDVDVLSGNVLAVTPKILAPSAEAVKIILEHYRIDPQNKSVVVFGSGRLVGQPVASWFYGQGAKVSVVDEFTKNPESYSTKAEILISGVGKPGLISGAMIKEGVVAIDFGYENKEGKMVGDFDFNSVSDKASLVTPVPGGVGPVVIMAVLKNLIKLGLVSSSSN